MKGGCHGCTTVGWSATTVGATTCWSATTCGNIVMVFRPTPNVTFPQFDDETAECIWMNDAPAWMDDDDLRHEYRDPSPNMISRKM